MDAGNYFGLSKVEDIAVVFHIAMPVPESLATKSGFRWLMLLNHGTHGAINDEYALFKLFTDVHKFVAGLLRFNIAGYRHSGMQTTWAAASSVELLTLGNRGGSFLAFISSVFPQL